jgi:hypothetical protein
MIGMVWNLYTTILSSKFIIFFEIKIVKLIQKKAFKIYYFCVCQNRKDLNANFDIQICYMHEKLQQFCFILFQILIYLQV